MRTPPHRPAADAFRHAVRVYWEDTDAGGIVFYANYLKFFERARTEWMRGLGFGQQALQDQLGCMFVVMETSVRFLRPARLDDLVEVSVEIGERGGASLSIVQQARRGDTLLATGDIRLACVACATLKPLCIPEILLKAIA